MTAGFQIRSAGYWLDGVAPYGDVETTWRWSQEGGGLDTVRWAMDLPYDFDHPAIRRGARVELMDGASRVGQAILGEPGRTETGKSFTATGLYRTAETFLCLDAGGNTTTVPNTAVDQAAARGCPLTRSGSLSANPLNTDDVTEGLNYLDTLLTALALETSKWWWVDADAVIRLTETPTTPDWHLVPGVADPGVADDQYASVLFGRYRSGSSLATATATDAATAARWGTVEYGVDLTSLGSISSTRATNRLNGLLAAGKAKLTFTDRLEVDANQLLTPGGLPAPLSMVRAGHLVRAHGLGAYSEWLNGNPWLDFVIGEASWANGSDVAVIAPVGLASRTWEDLLAESSKPKLKP